MREHASHGEHTSRCRDLPTMKDPVCGMSVTADGAMNPKSSTALVLALDAVTAALPRVGGKGASLARLARAGLPVPPGFLVTTDAYRAFVEVNALQAPTVSLAQDTARSK